MKRYVSVGGTTQHIKSPDGGVTLCGLELEYEIWKVDYIVYRYCFKIATSSELHITFTI